jgi:glycosyltransferase involved in cell wall biosynthesis
MYASGKKLSFCISCKNRFEQISKTLPQNLADNHLHRDLVEFVLVDFGSTDGLTEWIINQFPGEIDSGYLSFFYTDELTWWSAPVAKNTAHLYASGEVLVNLDADNFTGPQGGLFVLEKFDLYGPQLLLHQFNNVLGSGCFGRIGMHNRYFTAVGGYNERLEPMGYQDTDLLNRLGEWGLSYKMIANPLYSNAIRNSKNESIKYCNSSLTWEQMEMTNHQTSRKDIYTGNIVANNGIFGIRKNMLRYENGVFQAHSLTVAESINFVTV